MTLLEKNRTIPREIEQLRALKQTKRDKEKAGNVNVQLMQSRNGVHTINSETNDYR